MVVSSLDGKSEQWRVKLPISHSLAWGLAWVEDLKRLAFIMTKGKHHDDFGGWSGRGRSVFTVDSSGNIAPMGINNARNHEQSLVLSPDGRKVAYVAEYSNCLPIQKIYNQCPQEQILMADLREGGIGNIKTSGGFHGSSRMAWSPDGERLFYGYTERFPQYKTVQKRIMGMATDGATELVMELGQRERIIMVQPSPDGKYLLFIATRDIPGMPVDLIDLDNTEITDICSHWQHPSSFGWASWSPDGSYIALLDNGRGPRDVLVLVKPDLSEWKILLRRNSDGNVVLAREDGPT